MKDILSFGSEQEKKQLPVMLVSLPCSEPQIKIVLHLKGDMREEVYLGEKGQHDPPPTTHHPPPVLREGSLKIFSEKKLKKFTYLNIQNKSVLYFSVFLFYF